MASPHICFFNRSYYPDFGATGQLLTELAEGLVRDYGCKVSVVTAPPLLRVQVGQREKRGWVPVEREVHNGVQILRVWGTTFPPHRFTSRAANYLSYFFSSCIAALCVPRPNVAVSLTDPPIVGLAGLLMARRSGSRFVFICQDIFPEVGRLLKDFQNDLVNWVLDRINRFLVRKADRVVALGETMRDRLIEGKGAHPSKVTVIHNWADCSAIVPGPKENEFSLSHGLPDRFVVMHSGNIGLSQNLDTLLDAAERLRPQSDLVVAIVGDGVKRGSLEVRVQSQQLTNVRFFPYQPKENLKNSFASVDVFVISLKAGLSGYIVPSKLYGILASGRPYVAAVEESCEVATITRKYNCGLLAKPGDAGDLAEKILTLYRDRDLARRLGANARKAAFEFDRPRQIRAYYELFHELAATPALPAPRAQILKRSFDVLLSGLGLLFSAPLWGFIALCIKLEDGGPVIYAQERVGKWGKRFLSLKFRSMKPDSDKHFGPLQAKERDLRVTRVGRILRAMAMDELPQLWNIFRGDMSFVGPRALMPEEIEVNGNGDLVPLEKIPGYEARHRVSPGLTGICQVYAPRDIPRRHKFKYDLLYIKKQSFWLDLKMIVLSFWITFRGKWESRGRKV